MARESNEGMDKKEGGKKGGIGWTGGRRVVRK